MQTVRRPDGSIVIVPNELMAAGEPAAVEQFLGQRGATQWTPGDEGAIQATVDAQRAREAEVARETSWGKVFADMVRSGDIPIGEGAWSPTLRAGIGMAQNAADQMAPGPARKTIETLVDIANIVTPDYREGAVQAARSGAGYLANKASGFAALAEPLAALGLVDRSTLEAPYRFLSDAQSGMPTIGPESVREAFTGDKNLAERFIDPLTLLTRFYLENAPIGAETAATMGAASLPSVAARFPRLASFASRVPTFLGELGDIYSKSIDEGRGGFRALLPALASAEANTELERLPFGMLLNRMGGRAAGTSLLRAILASAAEQMIAEPLTEGAQEISSIIGENAGGTDRPTPMWGPDFWNRVGTAAFGALGPGAVQSVTGGIGERSHYLRTAPPVVGPSDVQPQPRVSPEDLTRIFSAPRFTGTTGEPTPEPTPAVPGTPSFTPTPDGPDTVAEQIRYALDPNAERSLVLFTPGTPVPRGEDGSAPSGLDEVLTPHGLVWYNPIKISRERVIEAGAGETFDPTTLFGKGAPAAPVVGRGVVTADTPAAKNVGAEVVDTGDAKAVAEAAVAMSKAHPGADVTVKTTDQMDAERKAAAAPASAEASIPVPVPSKWSKVAANAMDPGVKTGIDLVRLPNGQSWFAAAGNRPAVLVRVGAHVMPFYRSAHGTGGKKRGGWHPFFGFGEGGWLVKGTGSQIKSGYGVPGITKAQEWLDSNFDWDPELDKDLYYNPHLLPLSANDADARRKRFDLNEYLGHPSGSMDSVVAYDGSGTPAIDRVLARLNAPAQKEGSNAEAVRSNQGQLPKEGRAAQEGEGNRGGNVEQAAPRQPQPVAQRAEAPSGARGGEESVADTERAVRFKAFSDAVSEDLDLMTEAEDAKKEKEREFWRSRLERNLGVPVKTREDVVAADREKAFNEREAGGEKWNSEAQKWEKVSSKQTEKVEPKKEASKAPAAEATVPLTKKRGTKKSEGGETRGQGQKEERKAGRDEGQVLTESPGTQGVAQVAAPTLTEEEKAAARKELEDEIAGEPKPAKAPQKKRRGGVVRVEAAEEPAKQPSRKEQLAAEEAKARQEIEDGAAELADLLSPKLHIVQPDDSPKMVSALSKIFGGVIKLGVVKFKQAAARVMETLRARFPENAPEITIGHLRNGYNQAARGVEGADSPEAVAKVVNLSEISGEKPKKAVKITEAPMVLKDSAARDWVSGEAERLDKAGLTGGKSEEARALLQQFHSKIGDGDSLYSLYSRVRRGESLSPEDLMLDRGRTTVWIKPPPGYVFNPKYGEYQLSPSVDESLVEDINAARQMMDERDASLADDARWTSEYGFVPFEYSIDEPFVGKYDKKKVVEELQKQEKIVGEESDRYDARLKKNRKRFDLAEAGIRDLQSKLGSLRKANDALRKLESEKATGADIEKARKAVADARISEPVELVLDGKWSLPGVAKSLRERIDAYESAGVHKGAVLDPGDGDTVDVRIGTDENPSGITDRGFAFTVLETPHNVEVADELFSSIAAGMTEKEWDAKSDSEKVDALSQWISIAHLGGENIAGQMRFAPKVSVGKGEMSSVGILKGQADLLSAATDASARFWDIMDRRSLVMSKDAKDGFGLNIGKVEDTIAGYTRAEKSITGWLDSARAGHVTREMRARGMEDPRLSSILLGQALREIRYRRAALEGRQLLSQPGFKAWVKLNRLAHFSDGIVVMGKPGDLDPSYRRLIHMIVSARMQEYDDPETARRAKDHPTVMPSKLELDKCADVVQAAEREGANEKARAEMDHLTPDQILWGRHRIITRRFERFDKVSVDNWKARRAKLSEIERAMTDGRAEGETVPAYEERVARLKGELSELDDQYEKLIAARQNVPGRQRYQQAIAAVRALQQRKADLETEVENETDRQQAVADALVAKNPLKKGEMLGRNEEEKKWFAAEVELSKKKQELQKLPTQIRKAQEEAQAIRTQVLNHTTYVAITPEERNEQGLSFGTLPVTTTEHVPDWGYVGTPIQALDRIEEELGMHGYSAVMRYDPLARDRAIIAKLPLGERTVVMYYRAGMRSAYLQGGSTFRNRKKGSDQRIEDLGNRISEAKQKVSDLEEKLESGKYPYPEDARKEIESIKKQIEEDSAAKKKEERVNRQLERALGGATPEEEAMAQEEIRQLLNEEKSATAERKEEIRKKVSELSKVRAGSTSVSEARDIADLEAKIERNQKRLEKEKAKKKPNQGNVDALENSIAEAQEQIASFSEPIGSDIILPRSARKMVRRYINRTLDGIITRYSGSAVDRMLMLDMAVHGMLSAERTLGMDRKSARVVTRNQERSQGVVGIMAELVRRRQPWLQPGTERIAFDAMVSDAMQYYAKRLARRELENRGVPIPPVLSLLNGSRGYSDGVTLGELAEAVGGPDGAPTVSKLSPRHRRIRERLLDALRSQVAGGEAKAAAANATAKYVLLRIPNISSVMLLPVTYRTQAEDGGPVLRVMAPRNIWWKKDKGQTKIQAGWFTKLPVLAGTKSMADATVIGIVTFAPGHSFVSATPMVLRRREALEMLQMGAAEASEIESSMAGDPDVAAAAAADDARRKWRAEAYTQDVPDYSSEEPSGSSVDDLRARYTDRAERVLAERRKMEAEALARGGDDGENVVEVANGMVNAAKAEPSKQIAARDVAGLLTALADQIIRHGFNTREAIAQMAFGTDLNLLGAIATLQDAIERTGNSEVVMPARRTDRTVNADDLFVTDLLQALREAANEYRQSLLAEGVSPDSLAPETRSGSGTETLVGDHQAGLAQAIAARFGLSSRGAIATELRRLRGGVIRYEENRGGEISDAQLSEIADAWKSNKANFPRNVTWSPTLSRGVQASSEETFEKILAKADMPLEWVDVPAEGYRVARLSPRQGELFAYAFDASTINQPTIPAWWEVSVDKNGVVEIRDHAFSGKDKITGRFEHTPTVYLTDGSIRRIMRRAEPDEAAAFDAMRRLEQQLREDEAAARGKASEAEWSWALRRGRELDPVTLNREQYPVDPSVQLDPNPKVSPKVGNAGTFETSWTEWNRDAEIARQHEILNRQAEQQAEAERVRSERERANLEAGARAREDEARREAGFERTNQVLRRAVGAEPRSRRGVVTTEEPGTTQVPGRDYPLLGAEEARARVGEFTRGPVVGTGVARAIGSAPVRPAGSRSVIRVGPGARPSAFAQWIARVRSNPEVARNVRLNISEAAPSNPMSVAEVERAILNETGWSALPDGMRVVSEPEVGDVGGATNRATGEVWINAAAIDSDAKLRAVLHEEMVHRVDDQPQVAAARRAMLDEARRNPELADKVKAQYEAFPDSRAVEDEVVAAMAVDLAEKSTDRAIKRFIASVEDAIYRVPILRDLARAFRLPSAGFHARDLVRKALSAGSRSLVEGEQSAPFTRPEWTFYHATTKERARLLRENGFSGSVPFERTSNEFGNAFYEGDRSNKLFVYDNLDDARFYGKKLGDDLEIVPVDLRGLNAEEDREALGRAYMVGVVPSERFGSLGLDVRLNTDRRIRTPAELSEMLNKLQAAGGRTSAQVRNVIREARAQQYMVPAPFSAEVARMAAVTSENIQNARDDDHRINLKAQRRAARMLRQVLDLSRLVGGEFGPIPGALRERAEEIEAMPTGTPEQLDAKLKAVDRLRTDGEGVVAWHRFLSARRQTFADGMLEAARDLNRLEQDMAERLENTRVPGSVLTPQELAESLQADLREWLETEPQSQVEEGFSAPERERRAAEATVERMFNIGESTDDLVMILNQIATNPAYQAETQAILDNDALTLAQQRDALIDGPIAHLLRDRPEIAASEGTQRLMNPAPELRGRAPIRGWLSLASTLRTIRGAHQQRAEAAALMRRVIDSRPSLETGSGQVQTTNWLNHVLSVIRRAGVEAARNRSSTAKIRRARVSLDAHGLALDFLNRLTSDPQYTQQVSDAADYGDHRYHDLWMEGESKTTETSIPGTEPERGNQVIQANEIALRMPDGTTRSFRMGVDVASDNEMRRGMMEAADEIGSWLSEVAAGRVQADPILVRTYRNMVLPRLAQAISPMFALSGGQTWGTWVTGLFVAPKAKHVIAAAAGSILEPLTRDVGGQYSRMLRSEMDGFNRVHAAAKMLADEWNAFMTKAWPPIAKQEGIGPKDHVRARNYVDDVVNVIAAHNQDDRDRGVTTGSRIFMPRSGGTHIVTAADLKFADQLKKWNDRVRAMVEGQGSRAVTTAEGLAPVRVETQRSQEGALGASSRLAISPGRHTAARVLKKEVDLMGRRWQTVMRRAVTARAEPGPLDWEGSRAATERAFLSTDESGLPVDSEFWNYWILGHVLEDSREYSGRQGSALRRAYDAVQNRMMQADGPNPRNIEELVGLIVALASDEDLRRVMGIPAPVAPAGGEPVVPEPVDRTLAVRPVRELLVKEIQDAVRRVVERYGTVGSDRNVTLRTTTDEFNTPRGALVGPGRLFSYLPATENQMFSKLASAAQHYASRLDGAITAVRGQIRQLIAEDEGRERAGLPMRFSEEAKRAGTVFHSLADLRYFNEGLGNQQTFLKSMLEDEAASAQSMTRLLASYLGFNTALVLSPFFSTAAVVRDLISTSAFHLPVMMHGLGAGWMSTLMRSPGNLGRVAADLARMAADTKVGRILHGIVPGVAEMAATHAAMRAEQIALGMADQRVGMRDLHASSMDALSGDLEEAQKSGRLAYAVARARRKMDRFTRSSMGARAYPEDALVKSATLGANQVLRDIRQNLYRSLKALDRAGRLPESPAGWTLTPDDVLGSRTWIFRDPKIVLRNIRDHTLSTRGLEAEALDWYRSVRDRDEKAAVRTPFSQEFTDAFVRSVVGQSTRPWAGALPIGRYAKGFTGSLVSAWTFLKGQPSVMRTTVARQIGRSTKPNVLTRNSKVTLAAATGLAAAIIGIVLSAEVPDELRKAMSGGGRSTVGFLEMLDHPELFRRWATDTALSANILPDMMAYGLGVTTRQYDPMDMAGHVFGLAVLQDHVRAASMMASHGSVADGVEYLVRRRIPNLNYVWTNMADEGDAQALYRAYRRLGEMENIRAPMSGGSLFGVQSKESALAREAANDIIAGRARNAAARKGQLIGLLRKKGGLSSDEARTRAEARIRAQMPMRRAFESTPTEKEFSVIRRRMSPRELSLARRERGVITVLRDR